MSENIQVLSFDEHVQKRPAMYLGSMNSQGIASLLKEILSDIVSTTDVNDYFFKISVLSDFSFSIEVRSQHSLVGLEKLYEESNNYFPNFHLRACKALSTDFEVSHISDTTVNIEFDLDASYFDTSVEFLPLSKVIQYWTFLNRQSRVLLQDTRGAYSNQLFFEYSEGLQYLYNQLTYDSWTKPDLEIFYDGTFAGLNYQICLGFHSYRSPSAHIHSFAENDPTIQHGSLVDGIVKGFVIALRNIAEELPDTYLLKKKKIKKRLTLVASVRGKEFQYAGSTKWRLGDQEVEINVKQLMKSLTSEQLTKDPQMVANLLQDFKIEKENSDGR